MIKTGMCWVCGKRLISPVTFKLLPGVRRLIDGKEVRMHRTCAEEYDEEKPLTARERKDT